MVKREERRGGEGIIVMAWTAELIPGIPPTGVSQKGADVCEGTLHLLLKVGHRESHG